MNRPPQNVTVGRTTIKGLDYVVVSVRGMVATLDPHVALSMASGIGQEAAAIIGDDAREVLTSCGIDGGPPLSRGRR